mgnify:CR=1 FL=1
MVNKYQKRTGTCKGPKCNRPIQAKGLCGGHYTQKARGRTRLTPLSDYNSRVDSNGNFKGCTFDGCVHEVWAAGLCSGHYKQKYDGRTLAPLQANSRTADKREGGAA